jgi:hypothetical protein
MDETNNKSTDQTDQTEEAFEWAIVEIYGHRKHAGRVREEERFGSKMLRIDIPNKGDPITHGWATHFYGGASIFSFSLTDEATVMRLNKPYESASRITYQRSDDDDLTDGEL